mgnify:CR=1 FL=1
MKKRKEVKPVEQDERKRIRDFEGLVTQLSDPDPQVRRWAARDLVEYGTEASTVLADQLLKESEKSVREAILTSMTFIGDSVTVEALVQCLRSEDALLRNEAIDVLKNLPEQVAPIMSGLLKDADGDVRIFAVNILEALRHPYVEQWLIEVIDRDPNVNVCATAVDLLAEVGTENALPSLLRLKDRFPEEPYIQFAVELALKRIRGE